MRSTYNERKFSNKAALWAIVSLVFFMVGIAGSAAVIIGAYQSNIHLVGFGVLSGVGSFWGAINAAGVSQYWSRRHIQELLHISRDNKR